MWTREALHETAAGLLAGRKFIVLANREPYMHLRDGDDVRWIEPASGVTSALDPVLRACGGTWVGHGSGEADRDVVDEHDRLGVPPDDPAYTLRRVWLTREEEEGYYFGFANEALWPLCHLAYHRPTFRASDWEAYVAVNRKFAEAVLAEAAGEPAFVFVQDYHFALVPRMLKEARPDLVVAQFWHIPWPNPEAYRICPWRKDLLLGLLGNDLLGFHTQYHCNNFLETVDRELEARIDREGFAVVLGGQPTRVRPFPISIDFGEYDLAPEDPPFRAATEHWRRRIGLRNVHIGLGVDRLDYTKGIPERLAAVERLFETRPEWIERFTFIQVGVPSRTHIAAFRRLLDDVEAQVERINWRFQTRRWRPILLLTEHHGRGSLVAAYRLADLCIVSSLHDGMNLVAKEFVASRTDGRGVLVLSPFAGAARDLTEAVIVNPFAVDEFAEGLRVALEMPGEEQEQRMSALRGRVRERNVFTWVAEILEEAEDLLRSQVMQEVS
ncbi:MAG: trehalose-6-phosphate synthase [Planctomycetota bacterium]